MNQGTKWVLLMKKNRSKKSHASVPLNYLNQVRFFQPFFVGFPVNISFSSLFSNTVSPVRFFSCQLRYDDWHPAVFLWAQFGRRTAAVFFPEPYYSQTSIGFWNRDHWKYTTTALVKIVPSFSRLEDNCQWCIVYFRKLRL